MRKSFTGLSEPFPGAGWLSAFRETWPDVRARYLSEGLEARPPVEAVRVALGRHMAEVLPLGAVMRSRRRRLDRPSISRWLRPPTSNPRL
jgi:hypothetical protein